MRPRQARGTHRDDGIVLMVGTALHTKGGVASVINAWRDAGLFERWQVHYVETNGGATWLEAIWAALRCYASCAWWMSTRRVRLVHVHHSSYVSFWRKSPVFGMAMLFRRRLVVSLHGGAFMDFYRALPAPARWWQRRIMSYACRYLVLTERWRQWALAVQPLARVEVVPNLVAHVPEDVPPYPSDEDAPVLLFLGRVEALKGVPELIQALALARARSAHWRLILGGMGEIERTQEQAQSLGLPVDAVQCLGWAGEQQKDSLLRECSAVILPSHIENMPVVILEAFAYARPVVATSVGGIPDLLSQGCEGFMVRPGNAKELADALVKLWRVGSDRRAAMGLTGRIAVETHYSPEVIRTQLDGIYRDCLVRRTCPESGV